MPAQSASIDPLAQLDKDLAALERDAQSKPRWDPASDDDMVAWCESELGVRLRLVPTVLAIFLEAIHAFQRRERLRLAVLGPRGGGKTKLTAAIELVAYRWFGYSWQNVGGSLEQAKLCYSYVKDAVTASPDLAKTTVLTQVQDTRSRKGDSISVSAASQTSVRGPHPVGSSGAGGLTLDEAAIIPDDIVDAAKGQLTTADPSALIQLSTMGEQQVGRFWELVSDPAARGYKLASFDVFDVAKRCPYDCATTCPVKEHFAQDCYEGAGATRTLVHAAYCKGKAHGVDGWISVDEIAQQWRELGRGAFERELMGKAVASVGHVYDPRLVDEAVLGSKALSKNPEEHRRRFLLMEKAVGIDHGFSSQCAVCYGLRLRDALLVYRWSFYSHERSTVIRDEVLRHCFEENIATIYADASAPNENEELNNTAGIIAERQRSDFAPRVVAVPFGKYKTYLVSEVRRRLEKKELFFAPTFGGVRDPAHERAMGYLKKLHYDGHQKIVKVDDHGPDSLLCLVAGFAQSFVGRADPTRLLKR
jgi:hypothetical protein